MTVTATPRVRWTAGRDRIAHAHTRAAAQRTVCGQAAVDERNAWDEQRRCLACRNLVDQIERAS